MESRVITKNGLDYIVYEDGRVFYPEREIVVERKNGTVFKYKRGYREAVYNIQKNGYVKVTKWLKHRLVAEAFIDKIAGKEHVNHIDGNKLNNNVNNLEWCTHKENVHHAIKNNLFKPFQNIKREGENNGNSKLNNEQVLAIVKDNRLHKEIAKEYKIDSSHVSTIKNGKYWSSITGIKYEKTRITSEDYNVCTEGRL